MDEHYKADLFRTSGPVHLTSIDWGSINDCKSVAACLVKGVYVLESDRYGKRVALAPDWWNYFNFQILEILVDKSNGSYFGAIFEYKGSLNPYSSRIPPRYVLALRGTVVKNLENLVRDIALDARLIFNRSLARDSRYQMAVDALDKLVSAAGPSNVWMAGHSLGAAIALQVGKWMAKDGYYIASYLFNPPFSSVPIIGNEAIKSTVRATRNLVTAGLCHFLKSQYADNNDSFLVLRPWIPYLFVHPKDPISSEYIGYFNQRQKMEAIGLGDVGKVATKSSLAGLVLGAIGRDADATHLIPSAYVMKNVGAHMSFKQAHSIHQWWQQCCYCHSQLHQIAP